MGSAVSAGTSDSPVGSVAVTLRPANVEDCRQIWLWRNDEETRRNSLDTSPIPFETHERWFVESLNRHDRQIYIISAELCPAGSARLDLMQDEASVSIHLAPEWRRRGIGPIALLLLTGLAFESLGLYRLVATVKSDNRASLSAFKKAGFTMAGADGAITMTRTRVRAI